MSSVEFPDKNLERAIREELKLSAEEEIEEAMLWRVDQILHYPNTDEEKIRELDGIQYLRRLTRLELPNNKVRDLSPLSKLPNLEILNINSNKIYDITPLLDLRRLKELDVSNNHIADFNIRDFCKLKQSKGLHLEQLKRFYLSKNHIDNIGFLLSQLPHLKRKECHLNSNCICLESEEREQGLIFCVHF